MMLNLMLKTTVLSGLLAAGLLALQACSAAGTPRPGVPSPTATASPTATPSASPSASASPAPVAPSADGPVAFADLQGYRLVEGSVELFPTGAENELKLTLVLKSQAELEKYLAPQAGSTPEPVDFGKSYVLLTVKLTWAYIYQAFVTEMRMSGGDLHAQYSYKQQYHADHMLNDHLRPIITVTRFDRVAYNRLVLNTRALPTASPSP